MTPSIPALTAARVLPFTPRPNVVRRSSWPFPVAHDKGQGGDLRIHAAQVIAKTARHWQVR
ncbi:hypothetical protein [Variovorax sp. GT1P44]|uniref:hypothetical protein n=1 Tax=Variovorax sp. GT1P44 TaxID=3443742 RepID=UPI003F45C3D2